MKKAVLSLVFLICGLFSVFATMVCGQEPQVSVDPSAFPKPKTEKTTFWKFKNDSAIASSFEAPNGTTLSESTVAGNETTFTTEKGKYEFTVGTNLIVPTGKNSVAIFAVLDLSVKRKFSKFNFTTGGSYYHSPKLSFAKVGATIDKEFVVGDKATLRPFTSLDWYVPTESSNNRVSGGLVWTNGMDLNFQLGPSSWELAEKFVSDTGAIQTGRRFGLISEATCLVPIYGGVRVGPKIGFNQFNFNNNRSRMRYGFVFRVG